MSPYTSASEKTSTSASHKTITKAQTITRITVPTSTIHVLADLMKAVRNGAEDLASPPSDAGRDQLRVVSGTRADLDARTVTVAPASVEVAELDEVLRRRHSMRFYTPAPVAADVLTDALVTALDADRRLWDEQEWATSPQVVVAALRVSGLTPGLYRFERDARTYHLLAPLDRDAVEAMVLQAEYADAPVIVATIGSLAAALSSRGEHGVRLLNSRAGGLCYSVLLAANARGVSGSVFAGFLASGLAHHLNTDGYHLAQVFAVSLGHPVPPPDIPTV